MYKLVPPKSKTVEYKSVYLKDITFILKVFDFDEDDMSSSILLKNAKINDKGEFEKDENKRIIINNDKYYCDIFELGVKEIHGLKTENFSPSWKVIKEIVNEILVINSVSDLEK
jgi:hypothetical protein